MSEENLENRERCLQNELTNVNRTLEDLKNTFHLKQQQHSEYQEKIENLSKQEFNLQCELEQLTKERQDEEIRLIKMQKDRSQITAQLQTDIKKLTEILQNKTKGDGEEVDLNCTVLGQKEMWNEEVMSKESSRDDLYHLLDELNSSIMVKTKGLEELRACVQVANSERLEMIDMLNSTLHKMTIVESSVESVHPKGVLSTCDSNSLFSEVNNKRVEMKKSLADLKIKCTDLAKMIDSTESERMLLGQIRREIQDVLDNHPKDALDEYNALVDKYRTTRESVEKANLEYQKLLSEKEKLSNSANSPDDIFSFHDEFIKRKEDTRKRLIHLFRSILYGNVTISQQKIESKRKHLKYNGEHNYILQELEEISSLIKAMEQLARENKENDPPQETAKKGNDPVAPVEKKVTFDETVLSPPPRRRGRLIQSKPVHIPSDPLQNTKK